MKRTVPPISAIIAFTLVLLGFNSCINPFRHHNAGAGIAYYRVGFPFMYNEVDSGELPFVVDGGILDRTIIGKQFIVHLGYNDSVDVLYLTGTHEHLFHTRFNQRISDQAFSIVVKHTAISPPADGRGTYTFKFLKALFVKHDGGIGYYSAEDNIPGSLKDITETSPFKITVVDKEASIIGVPVRLKLYESEDKVNYHIGYSAFGRDYEMNGFVDDTLNRRMGLFTYRIELDSNFLVRYGHWSYFFIIEP